MVDVSLIGTVIHKQAQKMHPSEVLWLHSRFSEISYEVNSDNYHIFWEHQLPELSAHSHSHFPSFIQWSQFKLSCLLMPAPGVYVPQLVLYKIITICQHLWQAVWSSVFALPYLFWTVCISVNKYTINISLVQLSQSCNGPHYVCQSVLLTI